MEMSELGLTESTTDWNRATLSASLNSSIVLKFLSRPRAAVELAFEDELDGGSMTKLRISNDGLG